MANSSSKGLTIGVIALVIVCAIFVVMTRKQPAPTDTAAVSQVTAPAQESASAPADAAPDEAASGEAAPDETPAPETDSAATETATETEIVSPGLTSPAGEASATAEPSATEESSTAEDASSEEAAGTQGSLLDSPKALDIDIDKAIADRSLGRDDAPVSMIEYASMTCPHCARFHNEILPAVKQQLIDTGKLRVIYRDYPLDTYAMKAAMMARCADPERYFDLVEVIFKNQDRWAKNQDPTKGLIQLGTLAGMNEDFIKACMANEELQSVILQRVNDAQKNYRLNATPTFIFNSGAEVMSGDKDVKDFVTVVNRLIRK